MTLLPLMEASATIQIHTGCAVFALLLGAVQLISKKGTVQHRWCGRLWVVAIVITALTSFWIHELRYWRGWSPIHLLSIWTLIATSLAMWYIHQRKISAHKRAMYATYIGLATAGAFTLFPGRIMFRVFFSP